MVLETTDTTLIIRAILITRRIIEEHTTVILIGLVVVMVVREVHRTVQGKDGVQEDVSFAVTRTILCVSVLTISSNLMS